MFAKLSIKVRYTSGLSPYFQDNYKRQEARNSEAVGMYWQSITVKLVDLWTNAQRYRTGPQ